MKAPLVSTSIFIFAALAVSMLLFHAPNKIEKDVKHSNSTEHIQHLLVKPYQPKITDVSLQWNIISEHRQSTKNLTSIVDTLGSGACAVDANNDDFKDIVLVSGGGFTREFGKTAWWHSQTGPSILINQKGRYFQAPVLLPLPAFEFSAFSCATADLDGDNDIDIVLSGRGGHVIYENNGNGNFMLLESPSLANTNLWSTQASLIDINNDGRIDLYSVNFIDYKRGARIFEQNQGFLNAVVGDFDPENYDPQQNHLYLNQGNFVFKKSEQTQFDVNSGRSLSAVWHDLNNDQRLDLIVVNSFGTPNEVLLNTEDAGFINAPEPFRPFRLNDARDAKPLYLQTRKLPYWYFTQGVGRHNSLLNTPTQQTGNFESVDVANRKGVAKGKQLFSSHWGATAVDINNDGFQDILVAAGSQLPDNDSKHTSLRQPNSIFINVQDKLFHAMPLETEDIIPSSSRALLHVDLNNDGTMEVLVSNNNDGYELKSFEPEENSWIGFAFSQQVLALGGTVTIHADKEFVRPIGFKQGLFTQHDTRIVFGLGEFKSRVGLTVAINGQPPFTLDNIAVNAYYAVDEKKQVIESVNGLAHSESENFVYEPKTVEEKQLWLHMHMRHSHIDYASAWKLWKSLPTAFKYDTLTSHTVATSKHLVPFLLDALSVDDTPLQRLAIHRLKALELEQSIKRLIPLFNAFSSELVCDIAQTFEHFFAEEEAVVYRAPLTITPAIKVLEKLHKQPNTSSDAIATQVCLIEMLAESENPRAVLPLVSLLQQNLSTETGIAAIEALGRIRDTRALETLQNKMQSTNSPRVIAELIIALSRLDDTQLANYIETKLSASINTTTQVLLSLAEHPDSVVVQRNLISMLLDTISKTLQTPRSEINNDAVIALALAYKRADFITRFNIDWSDINTPQQQALFRAKYALATPAQRQQLDTLLQGLSAQQIIDLLGFEDNPLALSSATVRQLAQTLSSQSVMLQTEFLDRLNESQRAAALQIMLKQNTQANLLLLLNHAIEKNYSFVDVIEVRKVANNMSIASANLMWELSSTRGNLSRSVRTQIGLTFNQLMSNPNLSIPVRDALLQALVRFDHELANRFLPNYINEYSTNSALQLLQEMKYGITDTRLIAYLESIALSLSTTKTQSLLAATLLPASLSGRLEQVMLIE